MSQIPNYYETLQTSRNATQEEILQAYRVKSLRTHPERLADGATPEAMEMATEQFQVVADAYYILSDSKRRREYDILLDTHAGNASSRTEDEQPNANIVFADAFHELLRPEVERHAPVWTLLGSVFGGGLGFIVANVPGLVAGGVIGSGLGAVRDAKGKAVLAAYNELNAQQRAEVLRGVVTQMAVLGFVI